MRAHCTPRRPLRVAVYDVAGRHRASLYNGPGLAGSNRVQWRPPSLPAGVYYIQAAAGGRAERRSVLLLK